MGKRRRSVSQCCCERKRKRRYAVIDTVDPTLHGEVERDFVERYGKRGAP